MKKKAKNSKKKESKNNKKTVGDKFRDEIAEYVKTHFPDSSVEIEVPAYGSNKLSMKTGELRPKLNKIDVVWDKIAISAKNQDTPGTAEQKLIYELFIISDYIEKNPDRFEKAYLVYRGKGIKLIHEEFNTMPRFINLKNNEFQKIEIISYDDFRKRHNNENIST